MGLRKPQLLPRTNPGRASHHCPRMTLPVVTAQSAETRSWGHRAAQRGSGAEVAARSDPTPGVRAVAAVPTLRAGGDRRPSCAPGRLGSHTQDLIAGRPVHHSLFQPVPTSPSSRSWDFRHRTLTISRLLGSPGVVPVAPFARAGHSGINAATDTWAVKCW